MDIFTKWPFWVVVGFLTLFWMLPAHPQSIGQPVPVAALACSKPQYVREMHEALIVAPDNQPIREFLDGFNAHGNKCLPLQGLMRYNGLYDTFVRSDGAKVSITEFAAHDGRHFYTWRVSKGDLQL